MVSYFMECFRTTYLGSWWPYEGSCSDWLGGTIEEADWAINPVTQLYFLLWRSQNIFLCSDRYVMLIGVSYYGFMGTTYKSQAKTRSTIK